MFTIIGGDGQEYGPVTTEQIRVWLAAGRANLKTRAKAAGSDEWRELGDFAEFARPESLPPLMPIANQPGMVVKRASLGSRLGAALLDGLLIVLAVLPGYVECVREILRRGIGPRELMASNFDPRILERGVSIILVGVAIAAVIQLSMLAWRGQTIGKRLVGIRVVRAADGMPTGFLSAVLVRSVLRKLTLLALFYVAPPVALLAWLVDVGFIFRDDHRTLHDLMAGTRVDNV